MTTRRRPGMNGYRKLALAVLCVLATGRLAAPAASRTGVDDDPEDRQARRVALQRSVRENCLICHSDDLITTQRLTPRQWKAEVEKMVGWGSPLPAEQQQPVIEFLTAEYPVNAAPGRPARMSYQEAAGLDRPDSPETVSSGDPSRGEPAYLKNCANCHGPDGQGAELGPNLVEKPVLFRKADYTEVIRRGRGRMPGFTKLLDPSTEADMLTWLRSRRYRPFAAPK